MRRKRLARKGEKERGESGTNGAAKPALITPQNNKILLPTKIIETLIYLDAYSEKIVEIYQIFLAFFATIVTAFAQCICLPTTRLWFMCLFLVLAHLSAATTEQGKRHNKQMTDQVFVGSFCLGRIPAPVSPSPFRQSLNKRLFSLGGRKLFEFHSESTQRVRGEVCSIQMRFVCDCDCESVPFGFTQNRKKKQRGSKFN